MPISFLNRKYFLRAVGSSNIGKNTDTDISVRCPICGDSKKNSRIKRLHLYHKNGEDFVGCFNGNCPLNDSNRIMYTFLREYFPELLSGYKREKFQNQLHNLSNSYNSSDKSQGNEDVFSSLVLNKPKIIKPKVNSEVITQDLTPYFTDIEKSPECLDYLKSRLIDYNPQKFGKWYFGYQNIEINDVLYNIKDSIIIPLYSGSEMYGFYSRNIHNKIFCTYMNSKNTGYKVWNWFNIDKTKPVLICEGIFDAISTGYTNIIACMSANIPNARLKELKKPIFVLDNDKTGLQNSLTYAQKGYNVYVQPWKYKEKDMNELRKNFPNFVISDLIKSNIFPGIMGEVQISRKLE